MNAELLALKKSLGCGHCGVTFEGSDSQAWKVKYEKRIVYCSDICRKAGVGNRNRRPLPNQGPCQQCGETFFSRSAKPFCSMGCYTKSRQFKAALKEAERGPRRLPPQNMKQGTIGSCLECGTEIYKQPKNPKKYCSQKCYRLYMAKRFDRWIADPQTIALPQNFDEFLTQDELPCLVEGCGWKGGFLSLHMNAAHGVPAEEFKRAAGFNLGSGIISLEIQEKLSARALVGIAITPVPHGRGERSDYTSLEGSEHRKKAMALRNESPRHIRTCLICERSFAAHFSGHHKYCSKACQTVAMKSKTNAKDHHLSCGWCGSSFLGNQGQSNRSQKGKAVFCSVSCRQYNNTPRGPRPTTSADPAPRTT